MAPRLDQLPERIVAKILVVPSGCWAWQGALDRDGYGERIRFLGRKISPHRLVYTLLVGEIPLGKQLDHRCENRCCVNPLHLRPVTCKQNLHASSRTQASLNARKTTCPQGHPLSGENLRKYRGLRVCKTCGRERSREYYRRKAGWYGS